MLMRPRPPGSSRAQPPKSRSGDCSPPPPPPGGAGVSKYRRMMRVHGALGSLHWCRRCGPWQRAVTGEGEPLAGVAARARVPRLPYQAAPFSQA